MDEEWRGSQAASLCPFLNPNADLNTIISHNALFCDRCRDEQILEKTKGEEIIFINNPPYWTLLSKNGESCGNEGFLIYSVIFIYKLSNRLNVVIRQPVLQILINCYLFTL